MYYYQVLPGDMQYHGSEPLTYSSGAVLASGSIVRVHLRAKPILAIVIGLIAKPSFAVKPITAAIDLPGLPDTTLQLLEWLRSYYPSPLGSAVRQFLPPTTSFPKKLAVVSPAPPLLKDLDGIPHIKELPPLTSEQRSALATINNSGSYLLHGITGSGKSRVYLELARRSLESGRSVLILTPEIGLTAQLTETFQGQFGSRVIVLHSAMTTAKRRDTWYHLLAAKVPLVVIGPRSALFSPLKEIGLVVVDESHDQAYKNESAPHYHAGRVASVLATIHNAIYISGSATPSVEDYYIATAKNRPIIQLNQLATATDTSKLTRIVVDLKDQAQFSRSRILSDKLITSVTLALSRKEQSLLFLNRRGTANVILCSNCGWQTLCPNCDLSLSYHADEHRLRCHICGYVSHIPGSCPQCGNADILFKSIGTKAVLEEVARLFPQAKLQRFDTDLHKDERLEHHIADLKIGSADIIIGTQIVAKGLDLPRLSVVGVISADSSLLIPDYTATEHTFQLLSQVIGRVGRGHIAGTVVIQSYEPTNATLDAAINSDWDKFYQGQIIERQQFKFPPFCFLLKLNCLRATSKAAETVANKQAEHLSKSFNRISVEGPTPAFHPREQGKYNWQILIKSRTRSTLLDIISDLPSGWSYDIDPINLL